MNILTRIKCPMFSLILLILLILSHSVSFADANKIFKENSKAVVVVIAYDKQGNVINQGSGFIVRSDGAVVTNYHVISKACDIKIKAGDKVVDIEGFIFTDKENDLVILKADARNMPVVKLGRIDKSNIGGNIYVISSPEGLENTISDGLLSGIREIYEKREILQITASISPGSSGGPVFNRNGEVVGVATFFIKGAQNLNFAMPVELIKDEISSKKVTAIKGAGLVDYRQTAGYKLGFAYLTTGKYKEAIETFKQEVKINPDLATAHSNLGLAYSIAGMHKEAIEEYKRVAKIESDNATAYKDLGKAFDDAGKYKEAIAAYKQAIRINPDDAFAHSSLGSVYDESGMYKEAIEAYKQAIRINPDDAFTHGFLGLVYTDSGMYKEAIESLKQAVKIQPDGAYSSYIHQTRYLWLGLAYVKSGMYKEAIEAYKQAIRIVPDNAEAHLCLGDAYFRLGAAHTMQLSQSRTTSVNTGSVYVYKDSRTYHHDRNCTKLRTTNGLIEFASPQDARNAGGIPCKYCDSLTARNAQSGLGMYKDAIQAFKQAIRINPDYEDAHYRLGSVYAKSGMYKEANEAFKQAIKINPDNALAHIGLGDVDAESGMYKEAEESYKQGIRIEPDNVWAHNCLGNSYVNLGMYKEAKEAFKQAIRIEPDNALAHYQLGILYFLFLNDRGSALDQYKILKNLDTEIANDLFNVIYK